MDSLFFWGFVLLAIIVVTPFMAYTALRRTAELKYKVSNLTAETKELRRLLNAGLSGAMAQKPASAEPVSEPIPAAYAAQTSIQVQPVVPVKAPVTAPVTMTPEPVITPVPAITPAPKPVMAPVLKPVMTSEPSVPEKEDYHAIPVQNNPAENIIQWLLNGNLLAKIGILLLFVGLSYLLKFSIENNILTPELRLIGAVTLSVVLFVIGWRVRDKNRLYSLIIQGGSLGTFYITIFAAYKLYQFLPLAFALLLMVIICMASIFFAVVQGAVSLAVLAVIGGYAAPVLLSTGSGNYIALFAYYLMLSASILVMNHWQGWRLLNIIGFAFTFIIGVSWGVNGYQPEYYLSCQIFIILNLILYGLMTQQYARHNVQTDGDSKQLTVDSVLLFAPPILAFSLQYAITQSFYLGTAISSLAFGLIYMVLTVVSLRRFREPGHRLSLGFLLLSIGFISLAVPLAMSAQWTSVVWTIEGLAILWFSCLQKQRISALSGTALVLLGFLSLLLSMDLIYWSQGNMMVYILQWVGLLMAGALHHHYRLTSLSQSISQLFLVLAMIVWGLWLWMLPWRLPVGDFLLPNEYILVGLAISVWSWYFLARRVQWTPLYYCIAFLWILSLLTIMGDIVINNHPMGSVHGVFIWLLIIASMVSFIRLLPETVPRIVRNLMHGATLWTLIGLLAAEVLWIDNRLPWGMDEWAYFINLLAICGVIFTLYLLQHLALPPMDKHAGLYWQCMYPLTAILIIMLISGNVQDGQLSLWSYIPLLNPLDEAGLFGIAALWSLRNALIRTRPKVYYRAEVVRGLGITIIALGIWWANGILIRALAFSDGTAWTSQALIQSRFIQTTLAIIWALAAVILMISATRYHKRYLWLAGAITLAIVIIKLFVIDMNQSSGLARAIAFISVALLILVVGYFSPLPPKAVIGKYNNKEYNG